MRNKNILTFVMAGGKGERLFPLTRDRTKPAVPFGGVYRIIDFTLSNCINSGIRKIHILIQYKSISLQRHLRMGWRIFDPQLDEYIDVVPAQQRIGDNWYRGTADAIYQNIYTIEEERADEILILAGDHVYKMNYLDMIEFHHKNNADLTVGVIMVPKQKAAHLGIIEIDNKKQIKGFYEKPARPKCIASKPNFVYASMGIYFFKKDILAEELNEDAKKNTEHDFGKNIIPQMIKKKRKILAYRFIDENQNPRYWRDIGTIDAYYESNMDLVAVTPIFNLYDRDWPIRTYQEQFPPAKTVFAGEQDKERIGLVLDSLVSSGCIISGGKVQHSILSPNVRVNSFSYVVDSILMEGVNVGRYAKIKRAIIDKDVNIPQKMVIGYDLDLDRKRFFVSDGGVVVVARKTRI